MGAGEETTTSDTVESLSGYDKIAIIIISLLYVLNGLDLLPFHTVVVNILVVIALHQILAD